LRLVRSATGGQKDHGNRTDHQLKRLHWTPPMIMNASHYDVPAIWQDNDRKAGGSFCS
jgi:hypothetical protein